MQWIKLLLIGTNESIKRQFQGFSMVEIIELERKLHNLLEFKKKEISIIIPVFNEAENISQFLKLIPKNDRIEIIVVDDSSSDSTVEIINGLNIKVTLIQHKLNLGYTQALLTGIQNCKGDIIITISAFEGYYPYEIINLLEPIITNRADIVIGSKYKGKIYRKISRFNKFTDTLIEKLIFLIFGEKISDNQSGFRAYTRDSLKIFKDIHEGVSLNFFTLSIINALDLDYRILEVPVTYIQRFYGIYFPRKVRITLEILLIFRRYFFKRHKFRKVRKYRRYKHYVKHIQDDILRRRRNIEQQYLPKFPEISNIPVKLYQNHFLIQKSEEIKEKAIWRYGEKIQFKNKPEYEELDSKNTFSSVKLSLSNPKLEKILTQQIKFSDINNDDIYNLIKSLPKVDLHCHLGGCARIKDLYEIAKTYHNDISLFEKVKDFFKKNKELDMDLFFSKNPKEIVKKIFFLNDRDIINSEFYASIIKYLHETDNLDRLNCIYTKKLDSGKKISLIDENKPNFHFFGVGLKKYLQFGDWGGSTLLQTEEALKKAIKCLCSFAREHNVKYLELRFNPLGYTKNGLSGKRVYEVIREAVIKYQKGIIINFIFISGKPKQDTDKEKIRFKQKLLDLIPLCFEICDEQDKMNKNNKLTWHPKLLGFDLAGFEDYFNFSTDYGYDNIIESIRNDIKLIKDRGIYITIHCGETEPTSNLLNSEKERWSKSVRDLIGTLNPSRLGHALNVHDSVLLKKLAKFKTVIELCPSSNCQIRHYRRTPWVFFNKNLDKLKYINKKEFSDYPLKKYLNNKLKICINTDNPAISKTDWTNEIFIASELCENNLTIEQIFELIYIGVEGSFLSVDDNNELKNLFNKEIENILNTL